MFGRKATLSEVTSAALRIRDGEGEMYEDIRRWNAPSECGNGIMDGTDRRFIGLFAVSGWDADEWAAAVERQTSARYAWTMGVDSIVERVKYEYHTYGGADPGTLLVDRLTREVVM